MKKYNTIEEYRETLDIAGNIANIFNEDVEVEESIVNNKKKHIVKKYNNFDHGVMQPIDLLGIDKEMAKKLRGYVYEANVVEEYYSEEDEYTAMDGEYKKYKSDLRAKVELSCGKNSNITLISDNGSNNLFIRFFNQTLKFPYENIKYLVELREILSIYEYTDGLIKMIGKETYLNNYRRKIERLFDRISSGNINVMQAYLDIKNDYACYSELILEHIDVKSKIFAQNRVLKQNKILNEKESVDIYEKMGVRGVAFVNQDMLLAYEIKVLENDIAFNLRNDTETRLKKMDELESLKKLFHPENRYKKISSEYKKEIKDIKNKVIKKARKLKKENIQPEMGE